MSFDSDCSDDYEQWPSRWNSCALPFNRTSLEEIILSLSDQFDFRVVLSDGRAKGALLLTTGLTLAGALIGRHYGGKVGTAVGGVVGGACGLGIVAVSMRDIWNDIKSKLSELFHLVYDYLTGLGLDDYVRAAVFLMTHEGVSSQLAKMIIDTASRILGRKIMSSLTAA